MSTISNPISTGGAGVSFEHQVQSYFIAILLLNGAFPVMPAECRATSIRLQARQAGFETDDTVIRLEDQEHFPYQLLIQIKRQIQITKSEAWRKTLTAAWHDFNNEQLFDPQRDRIALITGPLAQELQHLRTILGWARHSVTAEEFIRKVKEKRFSTQKKKNYLQLIGELLSEAQGSKVTNS